MQGKHVLSPTTHAQDYETLGDVEETEVALSNPELYIIINCKPTKDKVVLRSLVQGCTEEAQTNNWLYQILMTHLLMKCLYKWEF